MSEIQGDNISFDEKRDINVMKPNEPPRKDLTKEEVAIKKQALTDSGYNIVAKKDQKNGSKTWKSWIASKEVSSASGNSKATIREVEFGIMIIE